MLEEVIDEVLSYDDFRTGLTFYGVRQLLKYEQRRAYQNGQYIFVTRRTVLGRWHQMKGEMYKDYKKCNGNGNGRRC
ncbi:hypothetical protein J4422_03680 [Candidatus Pacearchaeota archaeon]|nr:hypothetical protein [Candidatus Pacearchaeota archaeon]